MLQPPSLIIYYIYVFTIFHQSSQLETLVVTDRAHRASSTQGTLLLFLNSGATFMSFLIDLIVSHYTTVRDQEKENRMQ